ncbi:MAG: MnhB domain-containing protein [Deltaproteobacteria bacterium]|nr:MnhB domain-containing protein [Deltaproteobacteria bacterium]
MNPDSLILKYVARFLVFFINIFAFHIFVQGHNQPGGGFIAGLISAISLILLTMSLGFSEAKRVIRFDSAFLAALGLVMAYATSIAPSFFGVEFLNHNFWHVHIPFLGDWHVGTPFFFDLGVYLVVVGVTSKIIICLSFLAYEQKEACLDPLKLRFELTENNTEQKEDA